MKDINICKPNASGLNYSADGTCYGTAVYINCDSADPATYMWGVDMSGVRIAGGFTYGIRIQNEGETSYNHDARIEAVMDGCETGVSVENCNAAHLAVTVQPRPAEDGTKYAKYGIKLTDSRSIDLTSSHVWDWDVDKTLLTGDAPGCEYQHIAMYGNCSGAYIYDASQCNSNYFWQRIYFDNIASMLTATVYGSKGKIPVDPKYAFYKNFRNGGYDFLNENITWRDYHNMVRYDVPVTPLNPYSNPNRLYRIGYFTIGSDVENSDGVTDDALNVETITIEENDQWGIIGWSNIFCIDGAINHYWSPLPSVYESRVPVYFYSKSGNTYSIYRLIADTYDIQQIYNCRVSITNARRFIFDFADMGAISSLSTSTYIRITPQMQIGTPKILGQYSMVNGKPVVCTKSATWSAQGAISEAATTKQLALSEEVTALSNSVNSKFTNLKVTAEQTDFVLPADGEYVTVAGFTDKKSPYQDGKWNNNGTINSVSSSIYIEPRALSNGDVVRIRGIDFVSSWPGKPRMYLINKSTGAWITCDNFATLIPNAASGNLSSGCGTYSWDASTYTLTVTLKIGANDLIGFGGGYASGYNASTVIMTVNEEIVYNNVWEGEPKRLDESLYAQNVMLVSPSGKIFELKVSDSGALSATEL